MNLSTETSSYKNNTPQQSKQGQSQKLKQTHNEKQNINTNIHENEAQNTKYEVRKWEPIPFSWRFGGQKVQKWSLWRMTQSVWVSFSWERKWIVIKSLRENWKYLKTDPFLPNTLFSRLGWVTNKSSGLAAKTLEDKIVKNFLSVFHDWKVYPRGSRELSRENLCVPLVTGPFTREQVGKINTRARSWNLRPGWPAIELPKQGNTVFEIFQFL